MMPTSGALRIWGAFCATRRRRVALLGGATFSSHRSMESTAAALPAWLVAALEILKGGAAVGAVWVAYLGLSTWRGQLRGNAEHELARRVLRAVLEVRREISAVRNVFISVDEMGEAFKDAGAEPADGGVGLDRRTSRLVYTRRWRSLTRALRDLRVELLEAEVLFGAGIRAPEAMLEALTLQLASAVRTHLRVEENPPSLARIGEGKWESTQRILYEGYEGDNQDVFGDAVLAVVKDFERILRPRITLAVRRD